MHLKEKGENMKTIPIPKATLTTEEEDFLRNVEAHRKRIWGEEKMINDEQKKKK